MIQKAVKADLDDIFGVIRAARAAMRAGGNLVQWEDGYPEQVLAEDIAAGDLYVVRSEDGAIHAAFAFVLGEEPTYARIEDGAWGCGSPYGTIHRLGSDGKMPGVFSQCLDFCKEICGHIRADTHADNHVMRHLLEKNGFVRRGIIYVEDGSPRIAYDFLA